VTEPTGWIPLDCHAHTKLSDGALTVEELVVQVRGRGVRPSVSDHLSTDVAGSVKTLWGVLQ
jgi:predicted metal-dependent phosphoesterase TrpH